MSNGFNPHEAVGRLRRLDCCAVSDALDSRGLAGAVSNMPQHSGSGRIAGRVITVELGTGDPAPGPPRHLGTMAIGLAGPDDVIVIEQRTGIEAGSWGGLLTLGAKLKGVAGVVADGPVRDIDEAQRYGFPIFCRALTARTARGRVVEKATNGPIRIGDIAVRPGDFVIADRSGVIFIPADIIEEILGTAEFIAAREAAIAKALLEGTPVATAMGGNYEFLLEAKSP